jgi:putative transposase
MKTYQSLKKEYLGRNIWACGYFCCTSGDVTDDMIKDYIENQYNDDIADTFKIE